MLVILLPVRYCETRDYSRHAFFFFRFYSTNSSFVHGGFDKAGVGAEPAYGQQEIHSRITQVVSLQEVQLLH